jgi:hypothetical protein
MSLTSHRCLWRWLPLLVMLWVLSSGPAKSLEPGPHPSVTEGEALEPFATAKGDEPRQKSSQSTTAKNGNCDDEPDGNDEQNGNDKQNGKDKQNGNDQPKQISDNSFLIEEAYNQEPGVVQHIMTWDARWTHQLGRRRDFAFVYVMELPLWSQDHQFSFTPITFGEFSDKPDGGLPEEQGGFSDSFLNYRCQLLSEDEDGWRPAVAPRASLILPTGDEGRGLGNGELGYQFNLPISKQLEPFAFHFNAGFTYIPNVSVPLEGGLISPGSDLHGYNLGGSIIWLASYEVNFLVECVALWNEELDDFGLRDRTTEVVVNPGVRWAVYTDDSVQWVLGASAPIGVSRDAPDYGAFFYLSVEHSFLKKHDDK